MRIQRQGDVVLAHRAFSGFEVRLLSPDQLFAIPLTVAYQAPLSMGFPRKEYLSGLPFFSPRDLPSPGIEPMSPALAGGFFTTREAQRTVWRFLTKLKINLPLDPVRMRACQVVSVTSDSVTLGTICQAP